MAIIPDNTNTTEWKIEYARKIEGKPRPYLGMSGIGNECLRAQWYGWRWAKTGAISVRLSRIFNRGHLEEASIIPDLKSIGIEVFRREGENKIEMFGHVGEEQEEIVGFHRHCLGHPDGRLLGVIEAPKTEHLLEMKTMKDEKYQILKEQGVRQGFPTYFAQMTKYMGKMKLTRGLFVATNKNDQARKYIRVKFDKKLFLELEEREENIIMAELPPAKRYGPEHYLCNWCNFYQICHLNMMADKNCRTCINGDIEDEGEWSCGITGKKLSYKKQRRGCHSYRKLF